MLGAQHEGDRGGGGHRGPNFQVWVAEIPLNHMLTSSDRRQRSRSGVYAARMVYSDSSAGYPDSGSGYGMRNLDWFDNSTVIFGDESSGWCHPVAVDVHVDGHVDTHKRHVDTPTRHVDNSAEDLLGRDAKCEAKSWCGPIYYLFFYYLFFYYLFI